MDREETGVSVKDELVRREHEAWRALSTDGATAAQHYATELAREVLVVLPRGLVIDQRQAVIDSMQGAPWDSFEISDERILELGSEAAVLVYRATARRAGQDYEALFNSTYVRQGGEWRLALHQQAPV